MERTIKSAHSKKFAKVDTLCNEPFALGESTLRVRNVEVLKFPEKVPLIRETVGKPGEEPTLFFFTLWIKPTIEEEVIQILDDARCRWHISERFSSNPKLGMRPK